MKKVSKKREKKNRIIEKVEEVKGIESKEKESEKDVKQKKRKIRIQIASVRYLWGLRILNQ